MCAFNNIAQRQKSGLGSSLKVRLRCAGGGGGGGGESVGRACNSCSGGGGSDPSSLHARTVFVYNIKDYLWIISANQTRIASFADYLKPHKKRFCKVHK